MFDIFYVVAQNIDRVYTLEPHRRCNSNDYPQSMFWTKNKKNRYTHADPSFIMLNLVLRGYTFQGHVFLMKALAVNRVIALSLDMKLKRS